MTNWRLKKNNTFEKKEILFNKSLLDDIIKYDLNYIYKELIETNGNIQIKDDTLLNEIYEYDFFDIINITFDGNCFFRSVSQYFFGNENQIHCKSRKNNRWIKIHIE